MDRDKYRRLFIDEAREGLRVINNELVALERTQGDGAAPQQQRERFDAVFRHAHSLKGMAAAMGFSRFAHLAHRLEDLADIGRQGGLLPAEAFDLLLEGCDVLDVCVKKVLDGAEDPDPGDITQRVQSLMDAQRASSLATAPVGVPTSALTFASAAPFSAAAGLVTVQITISPDASAPQVRAFVVHKALSAMAGWKETEPSPEALRQKELPDRKLYVRFDPGAADLPAIERVASAAQGVATVEIHRDLAPPPREEPTSPAPTASGERAEDERTVRVRTVILDEFIDSVGELLLARSRLRALSQRTAMPELEEIVDEVDRLTRELHGRVVAARMTPLSFMAERLPRIVRDLARQSKKPVNFSMSGMDIELDRSILDELQAPVIHMLRNAVDHAHEGGAAREAARKPPTMTLVLRALRDRDRVLIELEDDGGGIDPERVRKKAVQRGLIDEVRARALPDAAAVELVCLPGFSTVEQVTETSGRGVGMDVVKASLERLGGSLHIASAPGQGTRITLSLPLTVAIIQVLVVQAGGNDGYAIPVNRVERAVDIDETAVSQARGQRWLKVGERLVPFFDLGMELGHRGEVPRGGTAVVTGRGADVMAFRVDRITGQEEVVAKPLGAPLSGHAFLAGGAILADGRAAYILEPQRLRGP